jgi:WD40 repeat protein
MGAVGWQVKLLRNASDVSADHQILKSLGEAAKGFYFPYNYDPWCRNDPVLVLWHWGNCAVHLYDVDVRKSTRREFLQADGYYCDTPLEIQWAPAGKLLAITCNGHVQILDTSGEDVASISVRHPKYEYPRVFWWPDGKLILIVGRKSKKAKTRLSIFDSTSGRLLGITDFDPLDLLPYDQAAYAGIKRDRYSLNIGGGTRSVGYLLDTWSRLEFDIDQCVLRGTVYRPVGRCEKGESDYMCVARESSIEVTVRA